MVSRDKRKNYINHFLFAIICFALFIIQYIDGIPLKINEGTVVLLVPMVLLYAMFCGEWVGAIFGVSIGTLMDISTSGSICFNAISLLLLCCLVGLLTTYYVNTNAVSAIVLEFVFVFAYFILKFLFLFLFAGKNYLMQYFIDVCIPSAFLTSVAGIPMYFIMNFIIKQVDKRTNNYNL